MTATLREAARALLTKAVGPWVDLGCTPNTGTYDVHADDLDALRAALALPEAGWEAGARAMREVAAREVEAFGDAAACDVAEQIRHTPVPPSPAAPEATAESEVGWICVRRQRRGNLYDNASGMFDAIEVYPQTEGARDARGSMQFPRDWDVTRVRLTVEPSPVEPEETQPDTRPTRRTP